jgi:hypothetical protein
MFSNLLLQLAITIFCAYKALGLLISIVDVETNPFIAVSFSFWTLPFALFFLKNGIGSEVINRLNPKLAFLGLICSIVGSVIELNALKNFGFTFALASLLPLYSFPHIVWMIGSLVWMPFFTFFSSKIFPEYVDLLRVVLTLLITTPLEIKIFSSPINPEDSHG